MLEVMFRKISLVGLGSLVLLVVMMRTLAVDTSTAMSGTKLKTWYWMENDYISGQMTLWMAPHQTSGVVLLERQGRLKDGWGGSQKDDEDRISSAFIHRLAGRTFLVFPDGEVMEVWQQWSGHAALWWQGTVAARNGDTLDAALVRLPIKATDEAVELWPMNP